MKTIPKPRSWCAAALLLPLLTAVGQAQAPAPPRLAAETTIYRDLWGIPHVRSRTDAGAAFGFAYAQAEDYSPVSSATTSQALGRAAEVDGPDAIPQDRLNRALEIPRLAREEYRRLDGRTRTCALCDGFVAGLDYYLATHPEVRPLLLTRFEPWYPLAFIRYNYFQSGFVFATGLRTRALASGAGGGSRRERAPMAGSWDRREARRDTRCSSSIRTCLSSGRDRSTKATCRATRDGTSPATPGSGFRFHM